MRRLVLLWVAAGIVLAGLGGAYVLHRLRNPLMLSVATGPAGSFGAQFATAIVHLIALEYPRVRVTVTQMASEAEALEALGSAKADVAVARADTAASPGQTIAVLRNEAALFIIPHGSKASSVSGLRGETIGVVGGTTADLALLATVRRAYDLPDKPDPLVLQPDAVADAIRTKKVHALFVVGAVNGQAFSRALAAARAGGGGPARLLAIDEADAIVGKTPVLESVDLPKGVIQGEPALPDDDTSTVGVSTRLFATSRMLNPVAAEFTRILLTDKPKVAALMPKTAQIEAPDTDKVNSSLPVHPGTALYLSGNQPTLSDQAQNLFYWFGIVGSLFASLAAATTAIMRRLRPRRDKITYQLLELWVAAREAEGPALRQVERDTDEIVQKAVRMTAEEKSDELPPGFQLLVDQIRRTVDRRLGLATGGAGGGVAGNPVPVSGDGGKT